MGIDRSTIRLIAKQTKNLNLRGSCITLGVHGIDGQYSDIINILNKESYKYYELGEKEIIYDDITHFGKTLHQDSFFKILGFSKVDSLDYFENEKPTYVADLNKPLRIDLYNKYDMVFDGGTIEHCFNVNEVLSNVIKLLKVGGLVVHHVPMTGWVEHGFYQFSPSLFYDFYGANGFDNLKAIIHQIGKKSYYIDYDPDLISVFNNMKKVTMIFFIAQKMTELMDIKEPIQSIWLNKFAKNEGLIINNNKAINLKSHVKSFLLNVPQKNLSSLLMRIARSLNVLRKKIYFYTHRIKLV